MKKKILFLIHDLGQGGAEKVLVNLVNNIDKSKFDVSVVSLFGGGVNENFLKPDVNYSVVFKKSFPGNSTIMKLFSPKFLYKRFIKGKYDVIISYLEGPSARIVSGCTDSNTKLISWIHRKFENKDEASLGFRNYDEAEKCYSRFDRTVFVSKWVKDYFVNTFSFKGSTDVLYNTIECSEIISRSAEQIDKNLFNNECVNIVSVGSLKKVKCFERLVRIHKKLLDNAILNRIYILGIGPEKDNLLKLINANNVSDTFVLLGYDTNPYKYVKNADLYVCSSLSEGFSTSVTEALIVGTPVVTTLCSGMQEMLGENNEYGIVTDNNEDALYEGIKKILTTDGLLEHYSEKALERGKEFSTEKTVKAVEDMLLNL